VIWLFLERGLSSEEVNKRSGVAFGAHFVGRVEGEIEMEAGRQAGRQTDKQTDTRSGNWQASKGHDEISMVKERRIWMDAAWPLHLHDGPVPVDQLRQLRFGDHPTVQLVRLLELQIHLAAPSQHRDTVRAPLMVSDGDVGTVLHGLAQADCL
jgi:hypothetical protein